ncbi:MAG: ferredoxin [Oscillospiraceae bacterium]
MRFDRPCQRQLHRSCGLCVNMCGNVFLMTEEGVAAARDEIFPEQEAPAQEVAESCPVQAIEIRE